MKLHVGEQEGLWNYLHVSYLLFLVEKFKEYNNKKKTHSMQYFPDFFLWFSLEVSSKFIIKPHVCILSGHLNSEIWCFNMLKVFKKIID